MKKVRFTESQSLRVLKEVEGGWHVKDVCRELVRYVMAEHQASERRGCRIIGISRSLLHYRPNTERDISVIEALQKLAHQYPAYGFGLMFKSEGLQNGQI